MVPDDILQGGLLRLAVHLLQVEEALVPLGVGGGLQRRQQGVVLHGDQQRVAHLVLGGARVDAEAVDGHHGLGCIEGLILIVGDVAAVQGVGEVRAEAGHVEEAGAHADLLVRGEAQADFAVGGLLRQQLLHRLEDDGDARLVIRPQQGGAVGAHQVLAHELLELRELGRLHDDVLLPVQHHVPAGVVDDLGLHVLSGHVRGGVHVGDEADGGQMLAPRRGGQGGVDVALVVVPGVFDAQASELLHQQPGHVELAVRAGGDGAAGVIVALAVNLGVADQAVNNGIHMIPPYSSLESRFSGFRHFNSSSTKRPSLRMSTSSNQISPPPYSGVWIWIRSQWTAEWLPLEALS